MDAATREAKNKYHREWRKKNPDKVKQYHMKHWERLAKKEAQQNERETSGA